MMDNKPSFIDVKYYSRCLNATEKLMEWHECGGLRVGNVIEFEIVLKVKIHEKFIYPFPWIDFNLLIISGIRVPDESCWTTTNIANKTTGNKWELDRRNRDYLWLSLREERKDWGILIYSHTHTSIFLSTKHLYMLIYLCIKIKNYIHIYILLILC